jgi:hypothetical protein
MSKLQNELDQIILILRDKPSLLASDSDRKLLARAYELKALIENA